MARTEVTTAQWMEFVNTFSTRGGEFTQFGQPIRWGARLDQSYTGPGWRWELDPDRAEAAAVPVWGISWRESAMLCNWLHNDRSSEPASLTNGAYDTSTFGYPEDNFFNGFTDQVRRSPDARFWIPDLDEWIKGAFFDQAQESWRLSHYGSDTRPAYGWPSEAGAESSAGLPFQSDESAYYIPLNAYGTQSPFGLLSTSGGPNEWFEDAVGPSQATGLPTYRLFYAPGLAGENGDLVFHAGFTGDFPSSWLQLDPHRDGCSGARSIHCHRVWLCSRQREKANLMKFSFIPFLVAAISIINQASADIKVRVFQPGGGAAPALSQDNIPSGLPITINIQGVNVGRIFIFDGNSTIPNESIGAVTISGVSSAGAGSSLFVVIGNPLIASVAIPSGPDVFIDPLNPTATYAVNFGGLTVSSSAQRERTVFAAQISGNVAGNIAVAKIRRLVAGGSVSALLLGTDDLAGGPPGVDNDYAVGLVQAQAISSSEKFVRRRVWSMILRASIGLG